MNNLSGKKIIVIGGSRGIGAEIALSLQEQKVDLLVASRFNTSNNPNFFSLDITDQNSIEKFYSYLKNKKVLIDGLVFCAAKSLPVQKKKIGNNHLQDPMIFKDLLNTNLLSTYNLLFKLEKLLNNKCSIVLISSIGAHKAFPENIGYQVSKAGLESLSRSLAYDLSYRSIRANSLALGYFRTDMTEKSYQDSFLREERTKRTILNRWGDPKEICGSVEFLLSDQSSYITGSTIFIDGGWTSKGL